MMQFDRSVELSVFVLSNAFKFTDLHIDFTIDANQDSKPNKAKFGIYNLSEVSRGLISEEYQGVEFKAGYKKKNTLIFSGTITSIKHEKNGVDWYTSITAEDGGEEYFTKYFNKSYSKGTPIINIFKDLIGSIGLPFELNFTNFTKLLINGVSYSGKTKDILDVVCKDNDLEWSIQHGIVEIRAINQPILSALANAVLLSADTGMIDSPVVTDKGVNVSSLLNPSIKPSRVLKIVPVNPASLVGVKQVEKKKEKAFNVSAKGIYIADKVRHFGSNYTGQFNTNAECVNYD